MVILYKWSPIDHWTYKKKDQILVILYLIVSTCLNNFQLIKGRISFGQNGDIMF
ncbi:hypothetical protein RhiirA5_508101 [Rhizophagus irregularis]|uniref:Uncharacterized protein n=1 Tax=Rhizophagus irregularis TaxID=588596 RepID=A0A2N0NER6_9GLOM|nr:hypothetical protein RhiirA5_508101 [Rhizophagus irregularis]